MSLFLLKIYILMKLSKGETHTVNSLSRALAPYYNIIYTPKKPLIPNLIKPKEIPKIDVGKALTTLEKLGLIEKHPKQAIYSESNHFWTQEAKVYVITLKGLEVYRKIKQKYMEIENMLKEDQQPENGEITYIA